MMPEVQIGKELNVKAMANKIGIFRRVVLVVS